MSSHHIVRDEQEPALIIHRLDGFPYERLGSMLEWSPTVICCEPALEAVLTLGIKVDVIVIASDQDYRKLVMDQTPVKLLSVGNADFMATSLQVLLSSNHQAANIITSSDQVESVMDSIMRFANQMDLTVWDSQSRHILVRKSPLHKWLPKSAKFSLKPLDKSDQVVIRLPTDKEFKHITNETYSLESDGIIEIQVKSLPFIYTEVLD